MRLRSGVTLNVGASDRLGALKAQGTQGNPIVFTSDAAEPEPGDWRAITFNPQADDSNSVLEHCVIEYGGSQAGNICITDASPTIKNCTVRNSGNHGIYGSGSNSEPVISDNTLSDNGDYALAFYPNVKLDRVTGNAGSGNGGDGIGILVASYVYRIPDNVTWRKNPLPFIITASVTIGKSTDETATLTIEAGTEVRLRSGVTLNVGASGQMGALKAQGTQDSPVIFTSDASEPAPGDWQTITFNGQADGNSVLEHCVIEYGGSQVGNIYIINNALPTITNCTIRNSGAHGIFGSGGGSGPVITDNTLSDNSGYALAFHPSMKLDGVTGNGGSGNGGDGIGILVATSAYRIPDNTTWRKNPLPFIIDRCQCDNRQECR